MSEYIHSLNLNENAKNILLEIQNKNIKNIIFDVYAANKLRNAMCIKALDDGIAYIATNVDKIIETQKAKLETMKRMYEYEIVGNLLQEKMYIYNRKKGKHIFDHVNYYKSYFLKDDNIEDNNK